MQLQKTNEVMGLSSRTYKFNSNYVYSHSEPELVKIISLQDDDNKVFIIKGLSAEVFVKIANGESFEDISKYISGLKNAPSSKEIENFLSKFIDDLSKMHFIEAN